jgi:hypothetical protein
MAQESPGFKLPENRGWRICPPDCCHNPVIMSLYIESGFLRQQNQAWGTVHPSKKAVWRKIKDSWPPADKTVWIHLA